MGGVLIVGAMVASSLLWVSLLSGSVWLVLFFTLGCAAIGFMDDISKLHHGKGIRGKRKLAYQVGLGLVFVLIIMALIESFTMSIRVGEIFEYTFTTVVFPFFKEAVYDLKWLYLIFAVLVLVGASNAVNLTDGLDGLAIGSVAVVVLTYMVFSYLAGHAEFARYLQIPYVSGSGELTVFLSAVAGACLGFLLILKAQF